MTASTPHREGGAPPPPTYLLFKLQRGQLKQLDRCHVQTEAGVRGGAGCEEQVDAFLWPDSAARSLGTGTASAEQRYH